MRVDTVIVDMLAQLPAAAATVCGQSVQSLGEGVGGSMHGPVSASCKLQGVTVLLRVTEHAAAAAATPPAGQPPLHTDHPLS